MDPVTALILLVVNVVLLIEVPLTIRAAVRIVRRYRVRMVDSTTFRLLTRAAIEIATMGAITAGLVIYGIIRLFFPSFPSLPTGVFVLLLGIVLIVALRLPIVIDREMEKRAKGPDPNVELEHGQE